MKTYFMWIKSKENWKHIGVTWTKLFHWLCDYYYSVKIKNFILGNRLILVPLIFCTWSFQIVIFLISLIYSIFYNNKIIIIEFLSIYLDSSGKLEYYLKIYISPLPSPLPVKRPLDFGLCHVTCFGQYNVSDYYSSMRKFEFLGLLFPTSAMTIRRKR